MQSTIQSKTAKLNILHKKRREWYKIVTALACIVVFITTYVLIIPAITWDKTLICELEEHTHTASCYTDGVLTCGKTEHTHTSACYDAPANREVRYVCGYSEHTHTAECYYEDGTLRCTIPEHTHTDDCKAYVFRIPLFNGLPDTRVADPSTANIESLFKTGGNYTSANDGRVAVDKSVFVASEDNQFQVVLSAMGQSYTDIVSEEDMIHADIVFVVDLSSSMKNDMAAAAGETAKKRIVGLKDALNNTISKILAEDPLTRIGIVSYTETAMDGTFSDGTYGSNWKFGGTHFYLPLRNYNKLGTGSDYVILKNVEDDPEISFNSSWTWTDAGNISHSVDASKALTSHGTNTQAGLLAGLRMFQNADNTNYDISKREPILILITDGEPRTVNKNEDGTYKDTGQVYAPDAKPNNNDPYEINQKSYAEAGYWTIRTAKYVKDGILNKYNNGHGMLFYTIGPGVTSLYGKTVLSPNGHYTDDDGNYEYNADGTIKTNLEKCSEYTNGSTGNRINNYSEKDLSNYMSGLGSDVLSYSDFADWTLAGNLTPTELENGMNQIIAALRQITRPIITTSSAVNLDVVDEDSFFTFSDTLGEGMKLVGTPYIKYHDTEYSAVSHVHYDTLVIGSDNYTGDLYRFAGFITETSTGKTMDLSDVRLYLIENPDGTQTVEWQFPAELLPIIYHNVGLKLDDASDDSFIETDPIRLYFNVGFEGDDPEPGRVYYSNSQTDPAYAYFHLADDNPYYSENDRSAKTDKTQNNTGTLSYSSDYDHDGLLVEASLGNNGKLVVPEEFVVTKQWADGNPTGIASITAHLYADGSDTGKSVTLNDANDWTAVFSDLPVFSSGETRIVYTVVEDVPANYVVSGGDTVVEDYEYDITITEPYIDVTEAHWEDASSMSSEGTYRIIRNGYVLYDNGSSNNGSLVRNNTDTEGDRAQWIIDSSGYLKNKNTGNYLRINSDANTLRINSITSKDTKIALTGGKITLTRSSKTVYLRMNSSGVAITSNSNDGHTFDVEKWIPKKEEPKTREVPVHKIGHGFVLVNSPELYDTEVEKKWDADVPDSMKREISFSLYEENGGTLTKTGGSYTVSAATSWKATVEDLNPFKTYYIAEDLPDTTFAVSYSGGTVQTITYGGKTFSAVKVTKSAVGITLTNSIRQEGVPEHSKQIDAFRDGKDNPDTDLDNNASDRTDLYRIYLNIDPIDNLGTNNYTNLVITDTLSDYVDFYSADLDIVVKRIKNGTTTVVYDGRSSTPSRNADYIQSVSTSGKTIKVTFEPTYTLENDCGFSVSFNVKATQKAYDDYYTNVKNGIDGYDGIKGDAETDYGSNATSSVKPGFRSNTDATLSYSREYRVGGTPQYEDGEVRYNYPVIQVDTELRSVVKVWTDGNDHHTGDPVDIDLYMDDVWIDSAELNSSNGWRHTFEGLPKNRTYRVEETNVKTGYSYDTDYDDVDKTFTVYNRTFRDVVIIKTDESGNVLPVSGVRFKLYRNSALTDLVGEYVTDSDGKAVLDDLEVGKEYWLVEALAPNGYNPMTGAHPISIMYEGNAALTGDTYLSTDADGNVNVKNFAGTVLPSTGGRGAADTKTIGIIIIVSALTLGLVFRKKRERSRE